MDVLRRDPYLPDLAIVFDPEAFVAALRRSVPEAELGAARISYVRYKPGTSCLVGYELEVGGAPVDLHSIVCRPELVGKLAKARAQRGVPGPLGVGRRILDPHAIVVVAFPNDEELKGLACLADQNALHTLVRRLVPEQPELWSGDVRRLRYKPERRYVAQLLSENGPGALLKIHASPAYQAARRNAKAFCSRGALRLGRRLGHSDRYRVVAIEWLAGRPLNEAIADPELDIQAVSLVGAALGELHVQNPGGLPRLTRWAEAVTLLSLSDDLRFLCPHLARRLDDLARRLAARLVDEPVVNHPIHGDFSANQVLLTESDVAIIDLDEAARGDPAADLGLFVARLERAALRGTLSLDRVAAVKEALLEGYRPVAQRALVDRIDLYTATGLFRLAPFPFRNRDPNWPDEIEMIVERAEAILNRSGRGTTSTATNDRLTTATDDRSSSTLVNDPFGAADDPKMRFLMRALNPLEVRLQLESQLPHLAGRGGQLHVRAIRVVRYKPGRRCLIEYDLEMERADSSAEAVTLVGKARALGLVTSTYRLLDALWRVGFGPDSQDGIMVPEPIGLIPEFQMWLQRKVPGVVATRLLPQAEGVGLARRIAEAAHKLHLAGIRPRRRHSMADELRILHERLPLVLELHPGWERRLERLLNACDRLGAATPQPTPRGIHRDFYADHAILDGARLYLADLDLYCEGDPALDIGNFIGHLIEQALRTLGRADALADCEQALEDRFVALAGEHVRVAVQAYTTLTLARHVYLSTRFPERRPFTASLLDLCEERLQTSARVAARTLL